MWNDLKSKICNEQVEVKILLALIEVVVKIIENFKIGKKSTIGMAVRL